MAIAPNRLKKPGIKLSGTGLSEQDILNDVTGTDSQLETSLFGGGGSVLPSTNDNVPSSSASIDLSPSAVQPWYYSPQSALASLFAPSTPTGAPVVNSQTGTTTPATPSTNSGGALGAASSFLSFISNIPRVATLIAGGLLLAAGLFSLAGGKTQPVNITLDKALK